MPFVNIRTARGLLDDDQKARLLDGITDLMVAVEGKGDPAFRPFVWVLLEELEPGSWCVGGNRVSAGLLARLVPGVAPQATNGESAP